MKLIDSVRQCEGEWGVLETYLLTNEMIMGLCKDENYYHVFLDNNHKKPITKSIYDKLDHPYNDLIIEYVGVFPPKITMEHKYFERFIELVEKLDPDALEEDPFSG